MSGVSPGFTAAAGDPELRDYLIDAIVSSPARGVLQNGVVTVVADDLADIVLDALVRWTLGVDE